MTHKLTVNFLKDIYIDELKEKLGIDFKVKKEKVTNVLEGIKMYNLPKYEADTDLLYSKGIIYYDDVNIFKDVFTKNIKCNIIRTL